MRKWMNKEMPDNTIGGVINGYVEYLETYSHDPAWKPTTPVKPPLTDIEAIRKLMAKRVSAK